MREREGGGRKGEGENAAREKQRVRRDAEMNEGEEKRDGEGKGGEERRESDVWSVGLGLRNDACTSTVQVRDGGRGLRASCESRDGAGEREE